MQCPTSNPLCALALHVHNAKMTPIIRMIFLSTVQHSSRNFGNSHRFIVAREAQGRCSPTGFDAY